MPAEDIEDIALNASVVELGAPSGAVLFNLSAFGAGPAAVVDHISSGQKGIYAWFRGFHLPEDAEGLYSSILEAISAPKFQKRTGLISPYYEVALTSKGLMPDGKKKSLEKALKRPDVAKMFNAALRWSILFQAPLYIGKSVDLKARVAQHLKAKSPLRTRLSEASIDIDKCQLLILPIELNIASSSVSGEAASVESLEDIEDSYEYQDELIFEEVFSREGVQNTAPVVCDRPRMA